MSIPSGPTPVPGHPAAALLNFLAAFLSIWPATDLAADYVKNDGGACLRAVWHVALPCCWRPS